MRSPRIPRPGRRAARAVEWLCAFLLGVLVAATNVSCITMTDPVTGEVVVDWERQSRLVEAEAQVFSDLAVAYPDRSDSLNATAATLQAASDAIAAIAGADQAGTGAATRAAIEAALGGILPYLDDADDDIKFAAIAARAVLSVASVYIDDGYDGDVPFEPGDTVPK